jgi:signal transduction histidine kinase
LSTARLVSDGLADSAAPEVRRVVPTLVAAIDRAVALCTRTLDFTCETPPPLVRERFAFAALVDDVAQALTVTNAAHAARSDDPRIRNEVAAELIVAADRDQLYRVLFNLCRNAFEAGAQHVMVLGELGESVVAIEVADDGPGLPPKARDNLFQPFTGSARLGGTGLGLAIARELMRAHGGDIALVDSTAKGTIFRLTLPREATPRAEFVRRGRASRKTAATASARARQRKAMRP